MPRARTGTVKYVEGTAGEQGHYVVRITCPARTRPWIHLDPSPKSRQEARARERAAYYSERARSEDIVAGPLASKVAGRGALPARHPTLPDLPERPTLNDYADRWLERRSNRTASDDATRLRRHVLPLLGAMQLEEIRPRHLRDMIDQLNTNGTIGGKSIRHAYGLLRTLFRDAQLDELMPANPCVLSRGALPSSPKTEKRIYTPEQVVALCTDARVALDHRVLYALAAFTGMRHGEVAGRRWRDLDSDATPLGCLSVESQYEGAHSRPIPTRRARGVCRSIRSWPACSPSGVRPGSPSTSGGRRAPKSQ